MLTAKELSLIRGTADDTLAGTCNILAGTMSSDGMGGGTMTYGTVGLNVACKVSPKSSAGVDQTGSKITYHTDWIIHVPYDQALVAGYRVVFDSDNYEVVSVEDDHTWRTVRTATMKRVG